MAEVGIIGAGSWGTALAILLQKNGHQVTLLSPTKNEEEIEEIRKRRITKLSDVLIPEPIFITNQFQTAVKEKDTVVLAAPSPYTRSMLQKMKPFVKEKQKIVTAAKGMEAGTLLNQTEIIEQEIPWGRRIRAFRTKSCRGSQQRTSDNVRSRSKYKRDCGISPESFYESCISGLYKSRYERNRTEWFDEKCDCARSRHSGRTRVRR